MRYFNKLSCYLHGSNVNFTATAHFATLLRGKRCTPHRSCWAPLPNQAIARDTLRGDGISIKSMKKGGNVIYVC